MTDVGQEAFGVKLHAFGWMGLGSDAHKFVAVGCPGCLLEILIEIRGFYDQAVIASSDKWIGQAAVYTLPVMANFTGLSMHKPLGADYLSAKGLCYALMAKADTQNRDLTVKVPNEITTQAGFVGCTGTW